MTGASATPVSYALTGLTPNTKYFFRVKAVNSAGTTYGSVLKFTTLAAAPPATPHAATSVTATGATLNGTVNNENNPSTTVTFCYKATTTSWRHAWAGATSVTATQSPVTGASAHPRELRPDRPDAQHGVLLPGQGGRTAAPTIYGTVLNFTTAPAPTATTARRRRSRPRVPPSTAQSTTRTTPRPR